MKPLCLNPSDPARERRKLIRSRLYWFVLIIVIAPALVLFMVDGASVWAWIAGGAQGLTGWIPFVTNCGRCGVPYTFREAMPNNGLTPRFAFWRWPPDRCPVCDLDRR
jgi:hypothetical protein